MYSYPFNMFNISDSSKIKYCENAEILRSLAILLILFILCFRLWPWLSLCIQNGVGAFKKASEIFATDSRGPLSPGTRKIKLIIKELNMDQLSV